MFEVIAYLDMRLPPAWPETEGSGTQQQNVDDMIARVRLAVSRGERSGTAKLTEAAVVEIRRRYAERSGSLRSLAREYGVNDTQVHDIVRGEKWAHVA
jgi:hypothetical protein